MNPENKIKAFAALGTKISVAIADESIYPVLRKAFAENGWFDEESSLKAIKSIISEYLDEDKMRRWLAAYDIPGDKTPKKVGIVMAGNLPLVGWHDLMCVVMSGNIAYAKLSSKDKVLPAYFIKELLGVAPELGSDIVVVENQLKGIDAVIATGSGNTMRYFEYYFGKYPHIIRHNRSSVAVLSGRESKEELHRLGEDIFAYYGLGCRNVSHFYVPQGYDFSAFYEAIESYNDIINFHKYRNNYDYHKSLLLLNRVEHLDNGFLMLREAPYLASPMSTLHYTTYKDMEDVEAELAAHKEDIQCVVAGADVMGDAVSFGGTQKPSLADYADHVDTMKFLISL